jgi:hypothetical protein
MLCLHVGQQLVTHPLGASQGERHPIDVVNTHTTCSSHNIDAISTVADITQNNMQPTEHAAHTALMPFCQSAALQR